MGPACQAHLTRTLVGLQGAHTVGYTDLIVDTDWDIQSCIIIVIRKQILMKQSGLSAAVAFVIFFLALYFSVLNNEHGD